MLKLSRVRACDDESSFLFERSSFLENLAFFKWLFFFDCSSFECSSFKCTLLQAFTL